MHSSPGTLTIIDRDMELDVVGLLETDLHVSLTFNIILNMLLTNYEACFESDDNIKPKPMTTAACQYVSFSLNSRIRT